MTNDEGNVVKISPFSHIQLLLAILKGGNVASYLFGKPPEPPKGDKLEKEINLPPLHIPSFRGAYTQLLLAIFKRGNVVTGKRKKPPPSPLQRAGLLHRVTNV